VVAGFRRCALQYIQYSRLKRVIKRRKFLKDAAQATDRTNSASPQSQHTSAMPISIQMSPMSSGGRGSNTASGYAPVPKYQGIQNERTPLHGGSGSQKDGLSSLLRPSDSVDVEDASSVEGSPRSGKANEDGVDFFPLIMEELGECVYSTAIGPPLTNYRPSTDQYTF